MRARLIPLPIVGEAGFLPVPDTAEPVSFCPAPTCVGGEGANVTIAVDSRGATACCVGVHARGSWRLRHPKPEDRTEYSVLTDRKASMVSFPPRSPPSQTSLVPSAGQLSRQGAWEPDRHHNRGHVIQQTEAKTTANLLVNASKAGQLAGRGFSGCVLRGCSTF